ncbi:MAG TPA: ATP cone domain-containing protein, partial [Salinivirgaceae bacterium]|nr:ATP cone domain-containing protein [Salinivirgaceae bacterium]
MDNQTYFEKIVKRNGDIVPFQIEKIENAIFKAMRAIGSPDREKAQQFSSIVIKNAEKMVGSKTPTVEQIQDAVEITLFQSGDFSLLKAYMLYRKQHEDLRNAKDLISNIEIIDDYLELNDWRVK